MTDQRDKLLGLGLDVSPLHSALTSREAVRASRARRAPATCTLLYRSQDRATQHFLMAGRYPSREDIKAVYNVLDREHPREDPMEIARLREHQPNIPAGKLKVVLSLLKDEGLVRERRQSRFVLYGTPLDGEAVDALGGRSESLAIRDRDKFTAMVPYAQTARCRWHVLLEYFQEAIDQEHCGHCDRCAKDRLAASA